MVCNTGMVNSAAILLVPRVVVLEYYIRFHNYFLDKRFILYKYIV